MMEGNVEHYILNLRKDFFAQRLAEEYTDIQFVLADGITKAHKMIVSCSNEFWKSVLEDLRSHENDEQLTVIIPEESLSNVNEWLEKVYIDTLESKHSRQKPPTRCPNKFWRRL